MHYYFILNILIIYQGDFPEGGAGTSRIKDLCKGLRELGHSTTLMMMWASHFNDSGINKATEGNYQGTPFIYINKKNQRPKKYIGKFMDTLKSFYRSSKYLIKNRKSIDVLFLYSPDIHYNIHLYLLARLFSIPIIIEQTELKSSQYWQYKKSIFYYLNKFDEKYSHFFAKHITVNSTRLQQYYIKQYGNDRVHLLMNTIDATRFGQVVPKVKGCIGYIGSFGVKDGLLLIIEAFAKARKEHQFITLKLMGFCENPKNILELIKKLGLENCVELTGPLAYDDVPRQLQTCDLLLMNRIDSTYANYGFPNKLGEYMATANPVISTDVSDVSLYFKNREQLYIIPPNDIEALAQGIVQRYNDVDKFDQMGLSGKQQALALFDYKLVSTKLESVFKKVL